LDNFLKITCNCTGDFSLQQFIEATTEELKEKIGNNKVAVAVTGGVDSAVTAALLARAVGKRCTAVLIDTGLLRKGEAEETGVL
jgi:GMP synthase (glutamine-hydrolysing)